MKRDLLQRNRGLRAWRRRPLVWAAWVFLLGVLVTLASFSDSFDEVSTQRGDRVPATVLPSWDGGGRVPVRYRNPSTGHVREIVVPEGSDTVQRVGPVSLRVTPDHEDEGRPVGSLTPAHVVTDSRIMFDGEADRTTWISVMIWTAVILGLLAMWAWRRRRRVHQGAELLAATPGPPRTVTAVPCRGVLLPRRWTLALFDAGAGPDARSIGRLRVAPHAGAPGPREVEVYGDPHRWRRCIFVEPATGQRWLPLGHPLRHRLPRPGVGATRLDRWRPTGAILVVAGVALLVVGAGLSRNPLGELNARSEPVMVQLQQRVPADGGTVGVRYRFGGVSRTATVHFGGPQAEGARARLRVDPDHPTSLWQDGTESPPVTDDNTESALIQTLATFVGIGGLVLLRRPRTRREANALSGATFDPAQAWHESGRVLVPSRSFPTAAPPNPAGGPSYPPWVGPPPPPSSPSPPDALTLPPPPSPSPSVPAPGPPPPPSPSPPPTIPTTPPTDRGLGSPPQPPVIRLPGTLSLPDRSNPPDPSVDASDDEARRESLTALATCVAAVRARAMRSRPGG